MFRYELKYIINFETFDVLRKMLEYNCLKDKNISNIKGYKIRSIYYDSPRYDFFWDKVDSLPFRKKIRVRFYGEEAPETTFLEIKEKYRGLIRKKRLQIDEKVKDEFLQDQTLSLAPITNIDHHIAQEVCYFSGKYSLMPTVGVSYWRQAFVPIDDSDARITFDYDLQFLSHSLLPFQEEYWRNFLQPNRVILEIKIRKYFPRWLQGNLKNLNLRQTRYSKYCSALATAYPNILSI